MKRYLRKIKTLVSLGPKLAELSTCKRLRVGAIIFPVDCSAIYAIGYNGPSKGLSNDSCVDKEGGCGCVHAETNAVIKFNNDLTKPSILYSTVLPCVRCAALILNCANIVGVIWEEMYRDDAGYKLMTKARLPVIRNNDLESSLAAVECWRKLC